MIKDDISIYRFISFEAFVNIVQTQALTFVNHELWDDPYEGYIFKALKTDEGQKQIEALAKKIFPNHHYLIAMLYQFKNTFHGQSWTECEESDALWRIYSSNNRAVRIEVNTSSIRDLSDVSCDRIIYKDFSSLEDEIRDLIKKTGSKIGVDIKRILLRKRTAFKHEEEVRLLTKVNLNYLTDNKSRQQRDLMNQGLLCMKKKGDITDKEFQTGWEDNNKIKEIPQSVSKKIENIDNFIKSVVIHPLSSKWYVDTVKEYCKRNNINFIGKSKLYTFSHP